MKKTLLQILVSLICLFAFFSSALAVGEDVKVYVDGTEVVFDTPPQIVSDRTTVPMRAIFEAIGADVMWDENTKTVTAIIDSDIIALTVDSTTAYINGDTIELDVAPFINNGRTYVPLRFIGESTGNTVEWDDETKSVVISS